MLDWVSVARTQRTLRQPCTSRIGLTLLLIGAQGSFALLPVHNAWPMDGARHRDDHLNALLTGISAAGFKSGQQSRAHT